MTSMVGTSASDSADDVPPVCPGCRVGRDARNTNADDDRRIFNHRGTLATLRSCEFTTSLYRTRLVIVYPPPVDVYTTPMKSPFVQA